MTKKIKILWLSLLTALCAVCMAALALPSFFAKADAETITTTGFSDDNFGFGAGMSLFAGDKVFTDYDGENFDIMKSMMRFRFYLNNYDYEDLATQVSYSKTWWGDCADNVFIYEFTLYRGDVDGDGAGNLLTGDKQYSVLVVLFPDSDKNFYGYIAEKDYYYSSILESSFIYGSAAGWYDFESISHFDDIATSGQTFKINSGSYDGTEKSFGLGYNITGHFKVPANNLCFVQENGLNLFLKAFVSSPFSKYFIKARYCFQTCDYAGVFTTNYKRIYGEVYSNIGSVANILKTMDNEGYLEQYYSGDTLFLCRRVISSDIYQRVRIKYLTEIEGTPYATHNYDYVNVPVLQGTIYLDDVEKSLGRSLCKCLDSNAYCFKKITDNIYGDVYQLYYMKNVWLRTATVDGNYFDYFLDINDSYKEVYRPYVNFEILTNDIYEWVFSTQMISKFPALQNYRFNEIYGYFGLVVVPETYTLNSALKTFFDIDTSKIGVISNFVFERTLSYDAYQNLLNDYNYGFLSKLWSNVAGFVSGQERNATYYLIYSEPGTEKALIGEGGQTDAENPGSVIDDKVVKPIGGAVESIWNGVWGSLSFFSSLGTVLKIILGLLIIGVPVLIVVKVVFGRKKGRRK